MCGIELGMGQTRIAWLNDLQSLSVCIASLPESSAGGLEGCKSAGLALSSGKVGYEAIPCRILLRSFSEQQQASSSPLPDSKAMAAAMGPEF